LKNIYRICFFVTLIFFSNASFAETLWDLRSLANQPISTINLKRADGSVFSSFNIENARMVRAISDKISLQSGIYPVLKLKDSAEINAFAGDVDGAPTIIINKGMLDIISNDHGMAAAVIGHEMAHLYLKHGERRATNHMIGNIIALIAGVALEIWAERKIGVSDLGIYAGSAMGTLYVATYSRDQEREADKQGAIWASNAGYDPNGAVRLFALMEGMAGNSLFTFFKTHPNPGERVGNMKQLIASLGAPKQPIQVVESNTLASLNNKIDDARLLESPKSEPAKKGVTAFVSKDYTEARNNFEKCASQGEGICQNNLGVIYQNSLGVKEDKEKAISYYKSASDQNLAIGKYNYALSVARGEAGPRDLVKAIALLKESAELGSDKAMGTLAAWAQVPVSDDERNNLPSDEVLVNYARASAMRGSPEGMLALGTMYRTGYAEINKNTTLAENYLTQAADRGVVKANGPLYLLYKDDLVDKGKAEAVKTKMINGRQIGAMSYVIIKTCQKEMRDQVYCFDWTKNHAYAGSISSGRAYGLYLLRGTFSAPDLIEGFAWMFRSKNRGDPFAETFFQKYNAKLTPQQLDRINKRAAEIERQLSNTLAQKNSTQ
jgi:predicted Zn-dependent protease